MLFEHSYAVDAALYKAVYVASSVLSLPARANGGVFF